MDQTLDSRERLGVVGYIDAVPPGSGAFSVWAGSHRRVNSLLREGAAVDATGANGAASRGPSLPFRTVVPCPYMGSPYKREWVEA